MHSVRAIGIDDYVSVSVAREGEEAMKAAREIVHDVRGPCWTPNCAHDGTCDTFTAIIEQARRDGAEWARERAAEMLLHLAGRESWSLALAERIRALPVTP